MKLSPAWRRPLAALAAAGLAVLLSSCIKMDGNLTIEDETISGRLLVAIAAEPAQQLGLNPEEMFAEEDDLAQVPGVTANDYDDGTWVGAEYLLDRVPLDDLNAISEDDPDGLLVHYDPAAETYEFLMVVDLEFMSEFDDDMSDAEAAELSQLLDSHEMRIVVTFPGEVIEHNGQLAGTTVTWQPEAGIRSELRAVGRESGAGGSGPGAGSGDDSVPAATTGPGSGVGEGPGGTGQDEAGDLVAGSGSGSGSGNGLLAAIAVIAVVLLAAGGAATALLVRQRRRQPAAAFAAGSPTQQLPIQPGGPMASDPPTQPLPTQPGGAMTDPPTEPMPVQPPATPPTTAGQEPPATGNPPAEPGVR